MKNNGNGNNSKRLHVEIIGFGGTIGMISDARTMTLRPARGIQELVASVPVLKNMAELSLKDLRNLDSTNVYPKHWKELIQWIARVHDKRDGVIITHGTDTMAYTASALALGLGRGLKIPVVLTGSQVPLKTIGTDAQMNMENAMRTVCNAHRKGFAEVMIVFNDRVLRGCRSVKVSEKRFRAFETAGFPHLADITTEGIMFDNHVRQRKESDAFDPKSDFSDGVVVIDLVPGFPPQVIRLLAKSKSCKGLILRGFGAGNIPNVGPYSLIPEIERAVNKSHIPVLVSTKMLGGATHLELYEPGKRAFNAGAIPTGNMTSVMAEVKLMWAIAQGFKTPSTLRAIFETDYVGEI